MYIYIEIDTNDADYVGKLSQINQENLDIIKPLIEAIKGFKPYTGRSKNSDYEWHHNSNYPIRERIREDLGEKTPQELYPEIPEEVFELFENYCPYCEWGFHTIEEIKVFDDPIMNLL